MHSIEYVAFSVWGFEYYKQCIFCYSFSDPKDVSLTEVETSNVSETRQTGSSVGHVSVSKEHSHESAQRTDTAEQSASTAPNEKHELSNDVVEKSTEETSGDENSKVVHTVNNLDTTTNDT